MSGISNSTLVLSIVFMVVFWAMVIWLFFSKRGLATFRVFAFVVVPIGLAVALYLHWEPYVAMICLPAGFVAGVLFAEWHYGTRHITGLRSDLQYPHQSPGHGGRPQQALRPLLDSERDELTYQSGPAAGPRA